MAHPYRGRDHDDHLGDGHADGELTHPCGGADWAAPNQAGHTRDVGALVLALPLRGAVRDHTWLRSPHLRQRLIANDNPMKISFKGVQFAVGAFLLPFFFVMDPALLGEGST